MNLLKFKGVMAVAALGRILLTNTIFELAFRPDIGDST